MSSSPCSGAVRKASASEAAPSCGVHQRTRATDRHPVMSRPTKPPRSWSWTTTLLVLALAAGTTRCATTPQSSPQPPGPPPAATLTLRVEVADAGDYRIQTIRLEDYVRGSVPAEMPLAEGDAAVADRLARLQAILARTSGVAMRTTGSTSVRPRTARSTDRRTSNRPRSPGSLPPPSTGPAG